ncbi:MAG: hypothetical protein ACK40M_11380 [Flavobacteriales bacterium]
MGSLQILEYRKLYNTAHEKKEDCELLLDLTKDAENHVTKAYWAAAKMVSCKYILNPFIIIKVFNEGKNSLEKLIKQHPEEPELYYLRYTIQVNTPAFVGYNKNKTEDRKTLINYLSSSKDIELREHILFYLINTNDISEEEKQIIKSNRFL